MPKVSKSCYTSSARLQLMTNPERMHPVHDTHDKYGQTVLFNPWKVHPDWLTWNSQKALWLRPDLRLGLLSHAGDIVMLGHDSSRLSLVWA